MSKLDGRDGRELLAKEREESSGREDRRVGGRLASSLLDKLRTARLEAMSKLPSSNSTSWL